MDVHFVHNTLFYDNRINMIKVKYLSKKIIQHIRVIHIIKAILEDNKPSLNC